MGCLPTGWTSQNNLRDAFQLVGRVKTNCGTLSNWLDESKQSAGRFPTSWTSRNKLWDAFQLVGRVKTNCETLSQSWDESKQTAGCFPKVGMSQNKQRDVFPKLGRVETNCETLSQSWDGSKQTAGRFPKVGTKNSRIFQGVRVWFLQVFSFPIVGRRNSAHVFERSHEVWICVESALVGHFCKTYLWVAIQQ